MTQELIITVMRDAVMTVLKCSLPLLLAAMVIGIIVSIIQAATQVNEQTLAFVPKIIGVFLMLLFVSGYMVSELTDFFTRMYGYVAQLIF
ncbi:MAG: flagellar biosynthesis protein FliQ [Eubacteriales bacterium]|nr:flagellar biosynthesis protein FliQ [Eubacteriales bacterium]